MTTTTHLPHWNMDTIYPGLESEEFNRDFARFIEDVADFERWLIANHIDGHGAVDVDVTVIQAFEGTVDRLNRILERLVQLQAFISAFVSTDSRNSLAQARMSELRQHIVPFSQMQTRVTAWIGTLDVEVLIRSSPIASDLAYQLRKEAIEAQHLMEPAAENLAAELVVSGESAWSKLRSDVASQLVVELDVSGAQGGVPMTVVRNLAFDPNRSVRKNAYNAELSAWESVAVPLSAALNSIKGEANTLTGHRGWESALHVALFSNNIDMRTLDAMLEAARASFPDFRRYLRIKAKALEIPVLTWYDLFAPIAEGEETWEYDRATSFLLEQFGTFSRRLRDFAARAFAEEWIDAEPRPGKIDGAFCMAIRGEESRVLANFRPTYDGMSTLAHELGHAYHNFNLGRRSWLQRQTPMTLAETASIFCETVVREAALRQAGDQERISILEASLQSDCQVVVDITSRFVFEKSVSEARRKRELSVAELNELMVDAQQQTYGDALDHRALHPYMWAAKGHYYSGSRPFYNFPYMFGLLFGLGLYARYRRDPEEFQDGYDRLLSSTGMADVPTLAKGFGVDVHTPEFFAESLSIVRKDIDRFELLVTSPRT